MLTFTDPTLAAGSVIRISHVSELRDEIRLASLFVPHLDERPIRTSTKEYTAHTTAETEVMNVSGAGVIRSLHWVSTQPATSRLRVYVDGESTPRVDCFLAEWGFAKVPLISGASVYSEGFYQDLFGYTPADTGGGAYRHQPIPFHTACIVTLTNTSSNTIWFDAVYNLSTTVDFDYGRYNYFNWSRSSTLKTSYDWHNLLSISGKGAVYGLHHALDNEFDSVEGGGVWESNTEVLADGFVAMRGTGHEDWGLSAYGWQGVGLPDGGTLNPEYSGRHKSRSVGMTYFQHPETSGNIRYAQYRMFDMAPVPFDSACVVRWSNGDAYGENLNLPTEWWRDYPGRTQSTGYVLYYTET